MEKTVQVVGFALILIWVCNSTALAAPAKLREMTGAQTEDMSRFSFVFDQMIPEFEVKQSGQRVQVVLQQTRFGASFQKISDNAVSAPLVRVETRESEGKSVVELYFQDIPEFVDVAADARHERFTVNVFWDRKRMKSRPAILDRKIGRLKPIRDGTVAEKVITSEYSGRWIDFFRDFEWPPNIEIPIHFTFPAGPGPMIKENRAFFPEKLQEPAKSGLWHQAEQRVAGLLEEGAGGQQADFYRLFLAECRLRQKKSQKAREVLRRIASDSDNDPIRAWKVYYEAYALALEQKNFQADRLVEQHEKSAMQVNGLKPWFSILAAEIALAMENPQKALHYLQADCRDQEECVRASVLRRADAFYEKGRFDKAFDGYANLASDLHFFRKHPCSLANWATLLYRQKQRYGRAYRYFFLLSEAIKGQLPEQQKLADFWSAMARIGAGQPQRARLMLWEIDENAAGTEPGFRAWLKLIDMDVIDNPEADFKSLIPEYKEIIERADIRQVREEAFFKQILTAHLAGNDLEAVRLLGRFFDDYWAGPLQHEARSLFVEIFPGVVQSQVKKGAFFETLTLVAKHRDLLAQARITYNFLHDLGESYRQAGFLGQAASTYLYIMDFEKKSEKKEKIFIPLIRIFHQQKNYDQVIKYASAYLEKYSRGGDRTRILYFYAHALMEKGELDKAAELLHENKRPHTPELDYLAGMLFFDRQRYELAQQYLAWAAFAKDPDLSREIRFKRAEALFSLEAGEKAAPLYEKLLATQGYKGAAGFRLVQIYTGLDQKSRALNIYRKMTEMDIKEYWLELAGAAVEFDHIN